MTYDETSPTTRSATHNINEMPSTSNDVAMTSVPSTNPLPTIATNSESSIVSTTNPVPSNPTTDTFPTAPPSHETTIVLTSNVISSRPTYSETSISTPTTNSIAIVSSASPNYEVSRAPVTNGKSTSNLSTLALSSASSNGETIKVASTTAISTSYPYSISSNMTASSNVSSTHGNNVSLGNLTSNTTASSDQGKNSITFFRHHFTQVIFVLHFWPNVLAVCSFCVINYINIFICTYNLNNLKRKFFENTGLLVNGKSFYGTAAKVSKQFSE